ncbi:MAG: hypothetical protein ACRD3V_10905 [Vicinamibacteria bacterium]
MRTSPLVDRVIGNEVATPLEFWVAVSEGQFLQLDDVSRARTSASERRDGPNRRARRENLLPLLSQPELPIPLVTQFPFPSRATRRSGASTPAPAESNSGGSSDPFDGLT